MSPTIALVSGWVILFVVAVCLVFVQVRFVRGVAAAAQKVVTAERDLNRALETQILAQNKELLAVYGLPGILSPVRCA